TIFRLNTDGSGYAVLKSFGSYLDGSYVNGGLVLAGGTLYGTTQYSDYDGTIFAIGTNGLGYWVVREFTNPPDGATPAMGALALDNNGILRGATQYGASGGTGSLFKVGTNGLGYALLTNLVGYTDGVYPDYAALTAFGKTIYGTTPYGGSA